MSAPASEMSFRDTLFSVGRSDYVGRYHVGDYASSQVKHAERERVLSFITETNKRDHGRVRLLSLPAKDWTFERMLLSEHPNAHLVGIERSFSVYAQSRRAMPVGATDCVHKGRNLQDRVLHYGNGTMVYSRVPANRNHHSQPEVAVIANRLLLMCAETYATVLTTDYGASMDQRKAFFKRFYMRSAAWMDFTSTLCGGVETVLRNAPLFMSPGRSNPFVVTVMNCRDRFRGADSRIARMVEVQPAFSVDEHWTYEGKGGVSMLTVAGRMR